MESRGVIILAGDFGLGASGDGSWRLGERDLLGRLVLVARQVAPAVVVAPARTPLSPGYVATNLAGAQAIPPPDPAGSLGAALGVAIRLAGAAEVAVIPAGLPYLDAGWLTGLFEALAPAADGVCAVEGERRLPWLAVYRAAALAAPPRKGAQGAGDGLAAPDGAALIGAGMTILPHPVAPAGPAGCTVATPLDSAEAYRRALAHHGLCDSAQAAVTLELFGSLRIRTGAADLPIHADTVGRALQALRRICPETEKLLPPEGELGEHFRFSINGQTVTTELAHPLREGDRLILFSATVGG